MKTSRTKKKQSEKKEVNYVQDAINRMKTAEITLDDAEKLSFGTIKELGIECMDIADKIFTKEMASFEISRIIRTGLQTDVLVDDDKSFLLKRIKTRANECDLLPETTKTGMILARRRLGGLVTPFIMYSGKMHGRKEFGEGMAAMKVIPLALEELGRKEFIDEYMSLMEECWDRGAYNHDFKADSLGRTKDGKLVILDIGIPNDIIDERIFRPSHDLFWDIFHIGIDKIHRLQKGVYSVNRKTGGYFKKQIEKRWDIRLEEDWIRKLRGDEKVIPLADILRNTVRKHCPPEMVKRRVWPIITQEIEDNIGKMIEERLN